MKYLSLVCLLASALMTAFPASAETPVRGGSLVICQPAEPPGLDPTAPADAPCRKNVVVRSFVFF